MQIYSIVKSLNKIKLFHNVSCPKDLRGSIQGNRGVALDDLILLRPKLDTPQVIMENCFELVEDKAVIVFFDTQTRGDHIKTMIKWEDISAKSYPKYFSEEEIVDIEFNSQEKNKSLWKPVEEKEDYILTEVEERINIRELEIEILKF